LAVTSSNDDGFREIQLNGKQLVFLFMAVTVVLVVTFLTGVLVGRGVRAERASEQQAEAIDEPPAPPPHATIVPSPGADPTKVVPTDGPDEGTDANAKPDPRAGEEPPVAMSRSGPPETPAAAAVQADHAKATTPPVAKPPAAPPAAARPAATVPPPAPPKSMPPAATAAPTAAAAPDTVRDGYAVQVAAVNARSEADSIARRLSAKGYSAYVEDPKGTQKMFRVRVGTFKSRSDAQTVANKLQKEEKFKPWVTR
jgi:cell division septation protein DedD